MTSPGTYELPGGRQAFAAITKGTTAKVSAGEGAILYRQDGTEESGSVHPVGAIAFDTTPSEPLAITTGVTGEKVFSTFQMPYSFEVPAGGTHTLGMSFAQGYTLNEVCGLLAKVNSGCQPSVSITGLTAGPTGSAAVTVSGTAADYVGLTSLTVNGHGVTVTGGTWTTSVALTPGVNPITAVATNQAGLTHSATASVTYSPPAVVTHQSVTPPAGLVQAAVSGPIETNKGKVTFTVDCTGAAGAY